MTWRKYFTPATGTDLSPVSGLNSGNRPGPARSNYSNFLPDIYTGSPNRVERYNQYNVMDGDSECSGALDILAEFCTQKLKDNKSPFNIRWRQKANNSEITIVGEYIHQWLKLQKFDTRIFRIVRNTFKYGDAFFIRDPETLEWNWIDPANVVKIIVNESDGKKPEQYIIKDLAPNFEHLVATQITTTVNPRMTSGGLSGGGGYFGTAPTQRGTSGPYPSSSTGSRFGISETEHAIEAKHIVHLSLSEGLDNNYPFGTSLLENVYKIFKQKELLEDAILIYRIHRAPERLIFKIDVGNLPPHLSMAFVERVKTEVSQRRIPTQSGGGLNLVDSTYNPISINDNFYFPVTSEGKGSSVEPLPGGCFSMDTKVSLLDGRELSITEISNELSEGKTLWTYSCEPITGRVVPGLISWAGVTQKNAKVMKITLDNNSEIICTPDHKFVQHDMEYRRAHELKEGDSLMPLYRKNNEIKGGMKNYEQLYDNATKEWYYTHRIVANTFKNTLCKYYIFDEKYSNGNYNVRHHKNFNKYDNTPENLCWMTWRDHKKLHEAYGFSEEAQRLGTNAAARKIKHMKENNPEAYNLLQDKRRQALAKWFNSLSQEEKDNMSKKQKASFKKYNDNLSDEERKIRMERNQKNLGDSYKVKLERMASDPEYRDWVREQQSNGWTEELRKQRAEQVSTRQKLYWQDNEKRKAFSEQQTVTYSHKMLLKAIDLIKDKTSHQVTGRDVIQALNNDPEVTTELYSLNKDKNVRNWSLERGITLTGLSNMARQFGYDSWIDLRKKEGIHNHRITKIEYLDKLIDVGTLTIDQDEIYHNYHTFALSAGVFVYNSNLGEITDLQYFTNKLFRGLKIPSSYLPTGAEDSMTAFNDGRVGTAYIQELRFNKYCERLQSLLVSVFDTEFKMYMYSRGMNIDPSLFELQFNPPMNFASARQSELDNQRINTFTNIQAIPYMSKRFALKRFLGLTDEEVAENERMWAEEQGSSEPSHTDSAGELRSAGLSVGGIEGDLGMAGDLSAPDEMSAEMPDEEGITPPVAPSTPTSGLTA